MPLLAFLYEVPAESERMGTPPYPPVAVAGLVVISAVVLFATLPPFIAMALAVTAAVCWCLWLDRHPTS